MAAPSFIVQTILTLTVCMDAVLFLYLYLKMRRPSTVTYTLLLAHIVGILGWGVSILFLLRTGENVWAELAFAFPILLGLAKFFFVITFPENRLPESERGTCYYWLIFPTILVLALSLIDGALFREVTIIDGYYIGAVNGPYAFIYSLFITFLLVYPIYILVSRYRKHTYTAHIQEQIKYLLIGTAVFFVVGLTTNSIMPVFFNIYFFNGLGPSFSLVFAGFVVYIITTHHFLGINTVLQRGLIYSVLLACIVSFYLGTIALISVFVQHAIHITTLLSAGLTTIVGIFSVPRIDRYLRRKTDRFFFQDHYNYADALYRLSVEVNKNLFIDDIKHITEKTLSEILKTDTVSTTIVPTGTHTSEVEGLHDDTLMTLTIPIVLDHTHIGTIHLGKKRSGDPYTQEDVVLIKTFSHQIALAFEKARLFKEVEDYSCELEERVRARTAEVLALQEQQSQMMLDLSHKLQNPLTIIKNEIALLRKNGANEVECALFEKTIDDTSAFIYDLLRIAHLETAENVFHAEIHDMSSHLFELIEYMTLVARERGITITHSIPPHATFSYDQEKVTELVTNLVSNAVKYMGDAVVPKERRIHVSLIPHDTTIELSVSDTGIGIDACDLPHIFDRFFRTDHVQGTAVRGTGLGLAICKKIVEMHGGTIKVTSTVGTGTTFTISLPTTTECRADAKF